ncbi:hypothetical protein, partial [Caballeronia cordobensis]
WFPTSTIRFSAETTTAFNFPPQLPRTPLPTLAPELGRRERREVFDKNDGDTLYVRAPKGRSDMMVVDGVRQFPRAVHNRDWLFRNGHLQGVTLEFLVARYLLADFAQAVGELSRTQLVDSYRFHKLALDSKTGTDDTLRSYWTTKFRRSSPLRSKVRAEPARTFLDRETLH